MRWFISRVYIRGFKMAAQIKINLLLVGELETGKSVSGREWNRRTCQVFTGEVAGNIPVYGTVEELSDLKQGYAMVDVVPRAGDSGRLEMRFENLKTITQGKPAQAAQA